MRQKLARVIGGVAMVALVAGGTACSSGDDAAGGGGDACGSKIAFFGALTGSSAALGINENNGVKLAVDKYNKENADCKVELASLDSQGSPDQAPGLAQKAIDDTKILGVVGPAYSGESEAAGPLFSEAGLVTITPSATRPSLADQKWKTFFRAVGNDFSQGPAAGNYMKNVMKADKVYVIDDQSAYGAGLADEVKKLLGSAVVGSDKVQGEGKQTEFSGVVTKVKAANVKAIFYGGYYQEAGLIRKQLTAAGVTAPLVAGDGVNDGAYITSAGQAAAEGTILTCPCQPAAEARGTFVQEFKALNGTDPGTYSDTAYDAANILLAGIKAGKTTREGLLEFVKGYSGEGVAASYKFTENGELDPAQVKVWAFKVTGGKVVPDQEIPKS
ncbi:branched-chain amino acid ABC transporter substrate-binding protein [Micromonospora saelicesensis]|uniref:Branched-chain amino acid transport system substrate-binding protein n=1 Tax=Micromonospora saelicesensis TaxID=285676 RepID=A0A1C5A614_9ACTN|nr:branched-chain amino acid ABC transporter substrate-binding protein [Micromonospora saelicesensis]RAN95058.1 Leucine-, isoleucine-, valine-, threonine-, and alanine-binding protein [Micromonospora saelicesensis]RAO31294.1 Leucine-, isoleucine-, valine-, threonine-, and alanine-binding protein [Micromonospora saelicesensis]RAO43830.1 Leucine-, isoleucine-, valine-, threonine-, and alanine-binding protein [Micromonospora saelicesensis]RAO44701.1 Leucine-, isoleucine-, valine-, threonine-, and 